MSGLPLFRSVETAAAITDSVLVAFSGGKDSVVTLDVCMGHFAHVEGFFMYQVRGLSFQESILRYYEDKYGIPIHRIPHFELSQWLRYGLFRPCDFDCPIVSVKETYDYMRENTDIWWIAAGERIADSVWRRAMIKVQAPLIRSVAAFSLLPNGARPMSWHTSGNVNCVSGLNHLDWGFLSARSWEKTC